MADRTIASLEDLVAEVGCLGDTIESVSRAIYKGTSCGAWVALEENVVSIGSIVEGAEACAETRHLTFPFEAKAFWDAVQYVDDDASAIWNEVHADDDGEV